MGHLRILTKQIRETEDIASSLWFQEFGLSQVSIWDRLKLGVVAAAIVSRNDDKIEDETIVDLAIARVTKTDSFIVDPLFYNELNGIVRQIRDADKSEQISLELKTIASALLNPILSSLDVEEKNPDEKTRKSVEHCARGIGARLSVARVFYSVDQSVYQADSTNQDHSRQLTIEPLRQAGELRFRMTEAEVESILGPHLRKE